MTAPDKAGSSDPLRLEVVATQALRSIKVAHKDLAGLPQRGRVKSACATLEYARRELGRALREHHQAAARDLRDNLLTALGPDLRWGTVEDTVKVLQLLLDCLAPEIRLGEQMRASGLCAEPLVDQ